MRLATRHRREVHRTLRKCQPFLMPVPLLTAPEEGTEVTRFHAAAQRMTERQNRRLRSDIMGKVKRARAAPNNIQSV
jgi:hypothetical protein